MRAQQVALDATIKGLLKHLDCDGRVSTSSH